VTRVLLFLLIAALAYAQESKNAIWETIVAQERAELDSLKTGDMAAFAALLADDAIFVDDHGPAGKADVLKHTANFRLHEYTMTDVRFVALSADSGLIAYHVDETGISHGKEFTAKVYVSALWAKRGGKWLCVFGQETAEK
jgi:ketosteroid isomerase-like protein